MSRHSQSFFDRAPAYRWTVITAGSLTLGVVLGLVAVFSVAAATGRSEAIFPASQVAAASPTPSPASTTASAGRMLDPAAPVVSTPPAGTSATHLDIPSIGLSTDLESLALDSAGILHPPADAQKAGWYSAGVLPGQVGPAVIAGHIDTATSPAVFENLDKVVAGTRIEVTLSDGERIAFQAESQAVVAKSAFPTDQVYGNVPIPELRLITCDGPFDPTIGHYTDNLVVFATLLPR